MHISIYEAVLTFVKGDDGIDDLADCHSRLFFLRALPLGDQPVVQEEN
jgi:hypothetical protein